MLWENFHCILCMKYRICKNFSQMILALSLPTLESMKCFVWLMLSTHDWLSPRQEEHCGKVWKRKATYIIIARKQREKVGGGNEDTLFHITPSTS